MEIEFLNYIDSYDRGKWKADVPFLSICCKSSCVRGTYCKREECPNKKRDQWFFSQYYFEVDTETDDFRDRRWINLQAVIGKEGHLSGSEMISIIQSEMAKIKSDQDMRVNFLLNELKSWNYGVSEVRFRELIEEHVYDKLIDEL